jgi:protoheme ferro-lyase
MKGTCNLRTMKWILAGVLSFGAGWSLVRYLTVHPLQMSLFLAISLVLLCLLFVLLAVGFRRWQLLLGAVLSLALFLVGYVVTTHQVLSREDERPLPALTRQKGDPGDGHTAVIYLTHGEPETYSPMPWINTFREIDETDVPFVPWIARPFFLTQLRREYLRVGQSHHHQNHLRMIQALEEAYREKGDTETRFYVSFLDDDPRPGAATIQALNDGASKIIVAEVFVSISNHTAEGEEQVEEIRPEEYGVPVRFTGPLWDSQTLHQMFLAKANAAIGATPKEKVGILLVGHGQPDEWDRAFPTETSHEIAFREAVMELLEADGYRSENMSMAWMEFKEPQPAERVEELAANGVEKILYFAAAISADSLHSQYDIPALVQEAQVPGGIPLVNMGAWNDHPLVIEAIQEKIEQAMER